MRVEQRKQYLWACSSGTVRVRITADDGAPEYLVIDVSAGPSAVSYPVTNLFGPITLADEYKTTKILLHKIPAGSFTMGSPADELGHDVLDDETQHTVTLACGFYMGVFEVTQGQYTNVVGGSNSSGYTGAMRPVERVSWDEIRGGTWPTGTLLNTTFMGKLQSKTGLPFDLPTESQWEYACRGGTTGAWNNGTTITNSARDGNMDILGRYIYNQKSNDHEHATAGSYQANNVGLYDMHGNVWEWCLDWHNVYGGTVTNPPGAVTGTSRVLRGGSWNNTATGCRSAYRGYIPPVSTSSVVGFRVSLPTGL